MPTLPPDWNPALITPTWNPYEAGLRLVEKFQAAEGGAWTEEELRQEFGLTPAAVADQRREFGVVAWKDENEQFHYPKWQFSAGGALLPGIREVLQTFHSTDQWAVMGYFLSPRLQLDERTPLDVLRTGDKDRVLDHARIHFQEGTW